MMAIFFLHSGNTDMMKFCPCAQDSYTGSYKKVLSEFKEFCMCSACVMMNCKETPPSDCEV